MVKRKQFSEAVATYETAIAILDQAEKHVSLQQGVAEMLSLQAVLYGNTAQC